MSGCAKCGDCCEEIWIAYSKAGLERELASGELSSKNAESMRFVLKHWTRIPRNRLSRNNVAPGGFYYTCDRFDAVERTCTAHEDRPPICQDFPWYGKEPDPVRLTGHRRCSFWHDVPQELWPDNLEPLEAPVEISR